MIKNIAKTNETEKYQRKVNEIKSWFSGNMNKVGKPLVRLTAKEKTQITKMNSERGDITTNLIELKGFIKEYYNQIYVNNSLVEHKMKWIKFQQDKNYQKETDLRTNLRTDLRTNRKI